MRHGKKPTLAQKKYLAELRLNPENWHVSKDTQTEIVLIHKHTGTVRTIKK